MLRLGADHTVGRYARSAESEQRANHRAEKQESIEYFGCWLDINQTGNHRPPRPLNDGPYGDMMFPFGPVSIQELVRNHHQCLIAELFLSNGNGHVFY